MEGEKKIKRPRIFETRGVAREEFTENTEKKEYNHTPESENAGIQSASFNSERTSYNNGQRGYNNGYNRYNNGYNRRNNGGYNNRYNSGFNNRYNNTTGENTENSQSTNYNPENGYNNRNGYTPRTRYNNNRGGYNNNQGGYNNRGGYNNGFNRGGYNRYNNNGYNNRYNNYNSESAEGVQNNNYNQDETSGNITENGYNNRRNYNNRGFNNRGNYNNRGGYNNNQGGYNNRGGYNSRGGYDNGYNNRNQRGGFNNRRFTPRPQRIEYELPPVDPTQPIRLNKFLANAGLCSRREADEFIQAGEVMVNGEVITELGSKITSTDIVTFRDKEVGLESKVYVLLNKPKDCVTTSDDPQGRLTVMDIVRNACTERIYPVGRLDRNTTGVLLLTNDGDLASKLTHPKFVKKKIYHVWTDKDVTEEDMQRIADGIELDDGSIHADAVSYATETDRNQIGIEIHSGRNRIVRRIFEALGYHVVKLDRVYFAGLTKKNLPRGRWRYLTQNEVNMLMMGSFE